MLITIPQDRQLLSEEQLRQFLVDGYLELKITDVPHQVHQSIFHSAEKLFKEEPNPGNNIMAKIPAVSQIFTQSKILLGALESLLGPQIALQPHRFCHFSPPGFTGQQWHKDSYFGYVKPLRSNIPRYLMAMYYPQKVSQSKGPTAIKKQTQYYCLDPKRYKGSFENSHCKDNTERDEYMICEAGTVALIHYDIIHKATPNLTNENRFMFKFQYNRLEDPVMYKSPFTFELKLDKVPLSMLPMVKFVWSWLQGETTPAIKEQVDVTKQLHSKIEQDRFYAAYSLAQQGNLEDLFYLLHKEQDVQYKMLASLALCSSSNLSLLVQKVTSLLKQEKETYAMYYAFILSEIGSMAPNDSVKSIDYLISICKKTKDNLLRVYICEAVTNIVNSLPEDQSPIKQVAECLNFVLLQTNEENSDQERYALKNAEHAKLTAALCMARMGKKIESFCFDTAVQAIEQDSNRYVIGNLLLALERMESMRSLKKLLQIQGVQRLCPFTTKEKPF